MEITAIVVARSGSRRVKNKALQDIGGEPMLGRKIRQLLACNKIDRVVAGVDEELSECANSFGAEVVIRDDYHCDEEKCSANEMIGDMCKRVDSDVMVWAHPTNPLISTKTYDDAVERFLSQDSCDSLMSGVYLREHLWDGDEPNYNTKSKKHILASEIDPLFMQDGGIFIQSRENMINNSYFFGETPYKYEIGDNEFLDVNTPKDMIIARALVKKEL